MRPTDCGLGAGRALVREREHERVVVIIQFGRFYASDVHLSDLLVLEPAEYFNEATCEVRLQVCLPGAR